MKSVIIGIHGLGNKPPEKLLRSWWIESIQEGLERIGKPGQTIPFDMAYWSDVIYPSPLDPDIKDRENPLYLDEKYTRGGKLQPEESPPLLKELRVYIGNQIDRIFLNDDMSINFRNVTDRLIHRYFSDLETYYGENCVPAVGRDCSTREVILKRLSRKLEKYRGYRILLVAHSMGSIVAYDVLSELAGKLHIHTFMTIGSPLGLPIIVGRISALRKSRGLENLKPSVPESITESWVNLSDLRDRIALDHTLEDDYQENSLGLRVRDLYVYNDYEMDGNPNPHKSFGYLRAPETAAVVAEFMEGGRGRISRAYQHVISGIYYGLRVVKATVSPDRR